MTGVARNGAHFGSGAKGFGEGPDIEDKVKEGSKDNSRILA